VLLKDAGVLSEGNYIPLRSHIKTSESGIDSSMSVHLSAAWLANDQADAGGPHLTPFTR